MKTKYLYGVLLLFCKLQTTAQVPKTEIDNFAKEVVITIEKNLGVAPLETTSIESCNPLSYIDQFDLKKLVPKNKPFKDFVESLDVSHNNSLKALEVQIPLKRNKSIQDKAIENLARSKNVGTFIKNLTGLELYELKESDVSLLMDYYLNHPLKKGISTVANAKKFVKAKFNPCYATSNSELTLAKWQSYPNVSWELTTTVTIVCDCEELMPGDLSQGAIVFTSNIEGVLSSKTIKHLRAKLFPPTSGKSSCCGLEEPEEEEANENSGPTKEYTSPQQSLGVSGGIGLGQDFNETNVCVGAEYLYKLKDFGNSSLFIGANVVVENNSFNDFDTTWIGIGPTAQLFTPIDISKDVYMTNGISSGVIFGTNDSSGFKDDISGFEISLNTGINIPFNENISLSIVVPIVTHTNLQFTSQDGNNSSKRDATEVFFFKNSPVKFGARINID